MFLPEEQIPHVVGRAKEIFIFSKILPALEYLHKIPQPQVSTPLLELVQCC